MKKGLSALLALGVCAGLTGCSTLKNKNALYDDQISPVVEKVEPVHIYVQTTQGIRDYEVLGGEKAQRRILNVLYQIGIESGTITSDKGVEVPYIAFSKVDGKRTDPRGAIAVAKADVNRDLVISDLELDVWQTGVFAELDKNGVSYSDLISSKLNDARSSTNSVYNSTAESNRYDFGGSDLN